MSARDERWRCFVAAPIGDDLRVVLRDAVEGWRGRPDLHGLRWTEPESWHVTLAFLGSMAPADVEAASLRLDELARRHPAAGTFSDWRPRWLSRAWCGAGGVVRRERSR